ncbi:hypothetical protein D3C78_1091440 [compost metagenome]
MVPKDPQYRQMGRELSEKKEAWRKKLSRDEFAELEVLLDLQQIQGMELTTTFAYGFKLGAAMIIEIHLEHGTSDIAKCHDE